MSLITYFNYFVLFPKFLEDRKILNYLLKFIPPFLLVVFIHITFKRWLFYDLNLRFLKSNGFVFQHTVSTLFIIIFVSLLRFVEDWFDLETKKKELENQKLEAELTFLKAQINPHFLFNTLNNLYYLATIKSENTPEIIEKLSHMMRYMIYDSNTDKIHISKEIEYMKNYISLEKLRLNDKVRIDFKIIEPLANVKIVPLILITFLENAFKHGVSNTLNNNPFILAEISISNNELKYSVKNSLLAASEKPPKSGIGLANVKRRLDLSYPDKYSLTNSIENNIYEINLKIKLDEKI